MIATAAVVARIAAPTLDVTSLEALLTSRDGFGLETATALQRAVCRIADGRALGDLRRHPHVVEAVGDVDALPSTRPDEFGIISGVRTAKSLIAAALAIRATQTCDVTGLMPGEVPRVPVLSTEKDLAQVVYNHIRGTLEARPALRGLLLDDPTSDTLVVRHPSGRPVEIRVTAGKRAGSSLVARWLAAVIFDEAPRMLGGDDGVVNLDDALHACRGRILPGGQIVFIGSPWAPFGPVYDLVRKHHGAPSGKLVIVKAPAPYMNPKWWTPARCEDLRAHDPQAYQTDVLAEFADVASNMFGTDLVESCMRAESGDLEPAYGHTYVAAMDPATRGNVWALVVGTVDTSGRRVVAAYREWKGEHGAPLSPDAVLLEIAQVLARYGLSWVFSDQWAADALRDIALRHGLVVRSEPSTSQSNVASFDSLKTWAVDGKLVLPPDPRLRDDLKRVRRRITQNGVAIELPRTPDGRHCDGAAALAKAFGRPMLAPEQDERRNEREEDRMLRQELEAFARREREELDDL